MAFVVAELAIAVVELKLVAAAAGFEAFQALEAFAFAFACLVASIVAVVAAFVDYNWDSRSFAMLVASDLVAVKCVEAKE